MKQQRTRSTDFFRVEVASEDVIRRLDTLKQELKQELNTHAETWLNTLQEHYTEHQQAISEVKTIQNGYAKFFESMENALLQQQRRTISRGLKRTSPTQEQILQLLRQRPGEGQ